MKGIIFWIFTLLLCGFVIGLTGIVCADQGVNATPETQSLSTVTFMDAVGLATETDAGVWTTTSNADPWFLFERGPRFNLVLSPEEVNQITEGGGSVALDPDGIVLSIFIPESLGNTPIVDFPEVTWKIALQLLLSDAIVSPGGIKDGALFPGQIQYTTAYDATIVAQAGHTVLTKSVSIDTRNKVVGQSNVDARTGLNYIATAAGGNVVGAENLLIDGAGNTTIASDRMICQFSSQPADIIPAYCNIVQAGSQYDLTVGSVTTNANDRFVGMDATNPVTLNYNIIVKPYGTTPGQITASGSAMAYIRAHIQEARDYNNVTTSVPENIFFPAFSFSQPSTPSKVEDLTYSESTSAQGSITSFGKVIAYQSGKSLL